MAILYRLPTMPNADIFTSTLCLNTGEVKTPFKIEIKLSNSNASKMLILEKKTKHCNNNKILIIL